MSSLSAQLIDVENYALAKIKDVLELLDCPICLEQMFPPIYQCMNGHALCSRCKSRMQSSCPTCRCKLGDIRSLPFEKLTAILRVTCKYNKFGCFESFLYYAKLQHEQICKFRPYNCPFPLSNCMILDVITRISAHMKSFHRCKVVDHPIEYEYTYVKSHAQENAIAWELLMCKHLGEDFCLYIKSESEEENATFILYLMFIGDNSEVQNFRYRAQVSNGSRKTSHEGIPYSIRDGYAKVEASEDGLIINNKAARLFSIHDSSGILQLWVTCKIWKE